MKNSTNTAISRLLNRTNRILLVSPPIYDFRLEWPQWHQPTGLLQLAATLKSKKRDVRLIDCLHTKRNQRLPRRKIYEQEIEGHTFNKWHLGLPFEKLKAHVKGLAREGWYPDKVFITSLNSIWWESARDTIAHLRDLLPKSKFILGGAYPTVHPDHATQLSGADEIIIGNISDAAGLAPDLSLYPESPYSTGIYFYSSTPSIYQGEGHARPRARKEILREIKGKAKIGVREFVFFDEELRPEDRAKFGNLLDDIAKANLDVHFVLPGNISPRLITQDLAQKMRRARVTQIYLRCDLAPDLGSFSSPYITPLQEYERCVNALLKKGGFRPREGTVAAMLVVGLPYENLDEVSERLIRLAHIVGSVILVPFQYVPCLHVGPRFERALSNNGHFSPESFNSKLYSLARYSGKTLEDYLELTRLAALLNSKYRSKTFDFLGDSMAARMFRESIRSRGWDPFAEKSEAAETAEDMLLELPLIGAGVFRDDRQR